MGTYCGLVFKRVFGLSLARCDTGVKPPDPANDTAESLAEERRTGKQFIGHSTLRRHCANYVERLQYLVR